VARIVNDLGDRSFTVNGAVVTVRFHLNACHRAWATQGRGPASTCGCGCRTHVARASHIETRELLQAGSSGAP